MHPAVLSPWPVPPVLPAAFSSKVLPVFLMNEPHSVVHSVLPAV